MEHLALFNQNDEPLHKTIRRQDLKGALDYVRVVHVWLYFSDGTYLIQQRNKDHDPIPYQYATTTGMPEVEETPLACALREVKEELGLDLALQTVVLHDKTVTSSDPYKTITYRYFAPIKEMPKPDQLETSEVKSIRRVTLETILTLVDEQLFWNYEALLQAPNYFKALEVKR